MNSFKSGDIVVHKIKPEWGPGRILIFSEQQDKIEIYFSAHGVKKFGARNTIEKLIPWFIENETPVERHKRLLDITGKVYSGVKTASKHKHRVTHCWLCIQPLDNAYDKECISCGWILCNCGACGCNYNNQRKAGYIDNDCF